MCRKLMYLIFFISLLGLAEGQAGGAYFAAYWDARYPAAWAAEDVTTDLRDAFEAAAYEILDADQLKTWMDARIADGKASVVVFCRDIVPDTVAETNTADCTLRKYLDAGGKVVWYSDMPMYYQGHADGSTTGWSEAGMANILDIPGTSWMDDTGTTVTITAEGAEWGLTTTWTSNRWTPTDHTFTVLATDAEGNAAAYAKHFVPGDTGGGFVRIWDFPVSAIPSIADIQRVAEYGMGGNPYARSPNPPDGSTYMQTWANLAWFPGDFAVSHDVYFGEDFDDVNDATHDSDVFQGNTTEVWFLVGFPGYPYSTGLVAGTTYYWRIDEVNDANDESPWRGSVWSFWLPSKKAYNPNPYDRMKFVDPNADLSWSPGWNAAMHYVYFGEDYDTVKNATGGTEQATTTYDPGTMEFEKTYYWRVDEFDGAAIHTGDVWSFKVKHEGGGLKGEYYHWTGALPPPPRSAAFRTLVMSRIDPEVDFLWAAGSPEPDVINADQFAVRWVGEVEAGFSETYTFYTNSDDGVRLWVDDQLIIENWTDHGNTQNSGTIDLVGGRRYTIQMEMYENTGDAVAQLRWQSPSTPKQIIPTGALSPPLRASGPRPGDGATDVSQTPTLSWSAGDKAAQHDVYFGDDETAVANADPTTPGVYRGSQALDNTDYAPTEAPLPWNKTYYWRVDEVNNLDPESPWKGSVWSFTTANFVIVDDFESYTDELGERIFQTWIDGAGYTEPPPGHPGNGSGSTVGHLTQPFAERTIVHSGRQSMPFDYNNTGTGGKFFYSETERTWGVAQDWTREGVKALTLYFRGYPPIFVEDPPGTYTLSADGNDIWDYADQFRYAVKRLNGDGSIVAQVLSVQNTDGWSKAGVMIRETLDARSAHAMTVITPSNGVAAQGRTATGGASFNTSQGGITAPHWVKLTRTGNTFTSEHSTDGSAWQPIEGATPQDIPMGANVYIGLCLTSHNVDAVCVAEFSDVSTTGSVSGQWQVQDIGVEHPGNEAEQLYLAVEDSSNNVKVINHVDANATTLDTWQEWNTDLRDITGVNLTAVTKMYLGVGNREAPQRGGAGSLYFDDIRLYKPRCVASIIQPDADLSGNCVVDLADIEILAGEWLESGPGLTADLDADEDVDLGDFADIAEAWLEELLWPQP